MAAYRMTAARKAALRKAQTASARKRRGKGKGKLAKANRSASRNKRIAVVAATGGLALAAAGVAGAYYARKTAGGGPKPKKISYARSTKKQKRSTTVARKGAPRSDDLKAAGFAFGYQANYKAYKYNKFKQSLITRIPITSNQPKKNTYTNYGGAKFRFN